MLLRLQQETAIHLRKRNSEDYNEGNNHFCNAWSGDVCVEDYHGGSTECSPSWGVYNRIYGGVSEKGIVSNLYICNFIRDVQWILDMVDTASVLVDSVVGNYHAFAKAHAEKNRTNRIYVRMCRPWLFVWNTLCPGSGGSVRAELRGDGGVDYRRASVGLRSRRQQFCLWLINYAVDFDAAACGAQCRAKLINITLQKVGLGVLSS